MAPTTKTVAQLNPQGFYLGPTTADACQIVPGDWLIPAGAVDAPLPRTLQPLECARYAPSVDAADPWDYLPDYSRATVYSVATGERIDVPPGWTLAEAGGTLQQPGATEPEPAATLQDAQAELQRAAAAMRWTVETGGITVAGVRIGTAIEDQNRITSVIANAQAAGVQAVDFKALSGWVSLTLPELGAVAARIALHVQRCYSAERAHSEAIDALDSLQAAHAYDLRAGWPSTTDSPQTPPTPSQQEQDQ